MAQNRIERRGGGEAVQVAAERASDFLDELFRLHDARWQSRGEAGVLADDTVRGFHRDAIGGLFAAGLLRLRLLRIDGQIAGAYYGLHHEDRAYASSGTPLPKRSKKARASFTFCAGASRTSMSGAPRTAGIGGARSAGRTWAASDG
jgi:hypothetical protein